MSFQSVLENRMTSTIYIANPSGINAYGRASYGTAVGIKCRYEQADIEKLKKLGIEEVATTEITSFTEIKKDSYCWLNSVDLGLEDGRPIREVIKSETLRADSTLYIAYL